MAFKRGFTVVINTYSYQTTDGTGTTVPPPTGSREDPCRDSGDLDCQQFNDSLHICDTKDSPAALLYCAKFCGLCTPRTDEASCVDAPDVDCKKHNETENICALRTVAATKFCRKFCGYCNGNNLRDSPSPKYPTYKVYVLCVIYILLKFRPSFTFQERAEFLKKARLFEIVTSEHTVSPLWPF